MPITFVRTDATSGIESCASTTYSGPDRRSASVGGSRIDVARNSASATFGPFDYDATLATTTINGDSVQVLAAGQPIRGHRQ